jgi:hypothetical protein
MGELKSDKWKSESVEVVDYDESWRDAFEHVRLEIARPDPIIHDRHAFLRVTSAASGRDGSVPWAMTPSPATPAPANGTVSGDELSRSFP